MRNKLNKEIVCLNKDAIHEWDSGNLKLGKLQFKQGNWDL